LNNQEVEILPNSFQTKFSIETRQQYARWDWISSATRNDAMIYTLPYVFDKSSYSDATYSKSICPDYWSYDRVQSVEYANINFI
jgi:hypothetical protein